MNYIAWESDRISWHDLCTIAESEWLLDPDKWAFVSSSPKLLQQLGYIESYWNCNSIEDIKLALFNKKPIQTWSTRIDRIKTRANDSVVVEWSTYWHSFFICWYDDDKQRFILENSYWSEAYIEWYFFLNYSDFNLLFVSKYIMTDKTVEEYNEEILNDIDLANAKLFYLRGYTNGLEPRTPRNAQEMWATFEVVIQDIEKATWTKIIK